MRSSVKESGAATVKVTLIRGRTLPEIYKTNVKMKDLFQIHHESGNASAQGPHWLHASRQGQVMLISLLKSGNVYEKSVISYNLAIENAYVPDDRADVLCNTTGSTMAELAMLWVVLALPSSAETGCLLFSSVSVIAN